MRVRGFTLIELMISTAIAMLMAAMATLSFIQVRNSVERSEARLALHGHAALLWDAFHRQLSAVQPTGAMVVEVQGTHIRLVYLGAKQHNGDWDNDSGGDDLNGDLVWEQWIWDRTTGQLRRAVSSPDRSFRTGPSTTIGGVLYRWKTFRQLPQPRRWLDPTDPFGATGGLNDNVMFPSPGDPAVSSVHEDDIGDFDDLEDNLLPVAEDLTDLSFELVEHDGGSRVFDASSSTVPPVVCQGVWPDGRLAPGLADPPDYASSELADRPVLLRLRFTLSDPRHGIEESFCFSYPLPAIAGEL